MNFLQMNGQAIGQCVKLRCMGHKMYLLFLLQGQGNDNKTNLLPLSSIMLVINNDIIIFHNAKPSGLFLWVRLIYG